MKPRARLRYVDDEVAANLHVSKLPGMEGMTLAPESPARSTGFGHGVSHVTEPVMISRRFEPDVRGRMVEPREARTTHSLSIGKPILDKKLLDILACPVCKGPLVYDKEQQELVLAPLCV